MRTHRPHPLAAVSICSFASALFLPYTLFGLQPSVYGQAALVALGSPFIVLVAAHVYASRTWRRNSYVALLNVPLWVGWLFASVLMWYFKPGVPGALFLGALLSVVAALLLLGLRVISEAPYSERA
jgi:hypothetical protein